MRTTENKDGSARSRIHPSRKALRVASPAYSLGFECDVQNSLTCLEGPFGEVVRATGPMARANPFRFSTKFQDPETDLVFYGHRYYDSCIGAWTSRDPRGESGGNNLYGFLRADPISFIDPLGQEYQDLGQVTIFSAGIAAKSRTEDGIRDFRHRCTCTKGLMCKMQLLAFLITSKSFIGLYDVNTIDDPPPYKPYTASEVARNEVHEAKHRNHDRRWHDQNIAAIVSDFSGYIACSACDSRRAALERKWRTQWALYYSWDFNHRGSDWTEADRTPTPGEVNQDPTSWLWTMPVQSLSEPYEVHETVR